MMHGRPSTMVAEASTMTKGFDNLRRTPINPEPRIPSRIVLSPRHLACVRSLSDRFCASGPGKGFLSDGGRGHGAGPARTSIPPKMPLPCRTNISGYRSGARHAARNPVLERNDELPVGYENRVA